MKTLKTGLLIAIEGIDGSGKSTLATSLHNSLSNTELLPVLLTFEPGDTQLGRQLRELLQKRSAPMCDTTEYLLFAADRAQHIHDVVKPALDAKTIVMSDRMADSSLAYQGYGRGLDIEMISQVNRWALQSLHPDITLYVKISLATSLNRLSARKTIPTAIEQEKASFTNRVINGFETIFKDRADVIVLDGEQTPENIHAQAHHAIMRYIIENNLFA